MSKRLINIENYELYVIDFLEGNLPQEYVTEFNHFLDNHPDIKNEIEGLSDISVNVPDLTFSDKERLKALPIKSLAGINEDNYEDFFIGFHENALSEKERRNTIDFVDLNQHLKNEFELYKKIKLVSDKDITYKDKGSLKKRSALVPVWITSAAAVILIAIIFGWFLRQNNTDNFRTYDYAVSMMDTRAMTGILSSDANITLPETKFAALDKIVLTEQTEEDYIHRTTLAMGNINRSYCHSVASYVPDDIAFNIESQNAYTYNDAIAVVPEDDKPSLIGSIFNNHVKKVGAILGVDKKKKDKKDTKEPAFVKIVDNSILVFSTITGSETDTEKTYNTEGQLTSYKVRGKELMLNRNYPVRSAN